MPINICKHCGKEFQAPTKRSAYCHGPCFRAKERDYSRRHAASFTRQRRQTYTIVQSALVRGDLVRKPCEVCGKRDAVAHHDDYARPLDVRWLCRSHHALHHHEHGPGKNAFCEEITHGLVTT